MALVIFLIEPIAFILILIYFKLAPKFITGTAVKLALPTKFLLNTPNISFSFFCFFFFLKLDSLYCFSIYFFPLFLYPYLISALFPISCISSQKTNNHHHHFSFILFYSSPVLKCLRDFPKPSQRVYLDFIFIAFS